jgi:hypothetical protein
MSRRPPGEICLPELTRSESGVWHRLNFRDDAGGSTRERVGATALASPEGQ